LNKHEYEVALTKNISTFFNNPIGYVRYAFAGVVLDDWQEELLRDIEEEFKENPEETLQYAVSSGHGIGKSFIMAMLALWWLSTRPHCAGHITANSWKQVSTKTAREIEIWRKLAINGHWFEQTATRIYHVDHKKTWGIDFLSNSENNSESFAGTHSEYTFQGYDEGSAIPDIIWEVCEGVTTDGKGFWLVIGNPTRNTGRFKDCWGRFSHRWNTRQIDSRDAKRTNKEKIQEWIDDQGEDSDFVRVRVRGVFPRAASDQLIPEDVVEEAAQKVIEPKEFVAFPKILGVDVSRGGGDDSVIVMRQGPKVEILGTYQLRDLMKLSGKVVEIYNKERAEHVFVDSTGLGAGVLDRLRQIGIPVTGVNFAVKAVDRRMYLNTRSECWGRMKDWLMDGGSIPYNPRLIKELKQQTYGYTESLTIQLESKKIMKSRGLESPDIADAIAVTFYGDIQQLTRPKLIRRKIVQQSAIGWS